MDYRTNAVAKTPEEITKEVIEERKIRMEHNKILIGCIVIAVTICIPLMAIGYFFEKMSSGMAMCSIMSLIIFSVFVSGGLAVKFKLLT